MTRMITMTAIAAALALTTACSGEGTQEDNQAAAQNASDTADMNSAAEDPNNPYAQAEKQMGERMMAAVGQNAAETWVRKMIEHHRGALAMTDVLEAQGGDPKVLEKARKTVTEQRKELQELEAMLQAGVTGNQPANPFEQGEHRSHERMMAAVGANASETWLRKMIEHHRGGIEMSEMVIAQGGNAKVAEMARRSAAAQQRDIGELERLLGGATPVSREAVPTPTAARSEPKQTPKAAPANSEPSSKSSSASKATSDAAPKAAPKVEPKAAAPAATCAPEHRALGHC